MAAFFFGESEDQISSQRKAHDPDALVFDIRLRRDVAGSVVQNSDVLKKYFRLVGRDPFPWTIEIMGDENGISGCSKGFDDSAFSPIAVRPGTAVYQHYRQVRSSASGIEALNGDGLVVAVKRTGSADRALRSCH